MPTNNFSDLEEMKGPPTSNIGGPSFGQGIPKTPSGFGGGHTAKPPMSNVGAGMPQGNFGVPANMGTGAGGFGGIPKTPSGQSPVTTGMPFGAKPPLNANTGIPNSGGTPPFGRPGMPQANFGGQPNFSGNATPPVQEKQFVPINKEMQSSRENAVKKITSLVFSSFELIPLLVGTVSLEPFTRTLTLLSGVVCGANLIYGTLLGYETLLSPIQTVVLVIANSIWYIYAKNQTDYEDEVLENAVASLPSLDDTTLSLNRTQFKTDEKHDMFSITPSKNLDKNMIEKPPVVSVPSPSSAPNQLGNFNQGNLVDTEVKSNESPTVSKQDMMDAFKTFASETPNGFDSFDFSDITLTTETPATEEWEIISDTIDVEEEPSDEVAIPNPFTSLEEPKEEVPKDKSVSLFEDPEDLEINLDDFIPKSVDMTNAKSVQFDTLLESADLAENMKNIESMGSELSNLIALLGDI